MTSTPEADPLLLESEQLALAALAEITPAATVGPAAGYTVEADGAVSLRFENRLPGYPGWYWTVAVARVEGAEPTVLEVELLPGDGALLAPDWVPWAERLAEYRAHQAELAAQSSAEESDDTEEEDFDDELDVEDLVDAELDDEVDNDDDLLHSGDLDGVDIDELDDSAGGPEGSEPGEEDSAVDEEE